MSGTGIEEGKKEEGGRERGEAMSVYVPKGQNNYCLYVEKKKVFKKGED